MAMKVMLRQYVRPVRIEDGKVEVALTSDAPRTLLNDLSTRLLDWTGKRWVVSLSREEGSSTLAQIDSAKRETALLDARSDPTVAAILSRFPGAKVIDVRIPDAVNVDDAPEPADQLPDPGIGDDDEDF
jgi:DNA polymerase-3 subunit gamma/tau